MLIGTLAGHRKAVTCLAADEQALLSGSEDLTVRIWDVRAKRAVRCIAGCFQTEIDSIRIRRSVSDNGAVYVASGNQLFAFDLRYDGVLQREPKSSIQFGNNGDGQGNDNEISAFALNDQGNMVAVADDIGCITLVPISSSGCFQEHCERNRHKRLTRLHSNVISSVCFNTKHKKELISGGFDYIVGLWDIDRGRTKITSSFKPIIIDEQPVKSKTNSSAQKRQTKKKKGTTAAPPNPPVKAADEEYTQPTQMLNPPFIMAVDYMCDGHAVAVAHGDGTVSEVKRSENNYR